MNNGNLPGVWCFPLAAHCCLSRDCDNSSGQLLWHPDWKILASVELQMHSGNCGHHHQDFCSGFFFLAALFGLMASGQKLDILTGSLSSDWDHLVSQRKEKADKQGSYRWEFRVVWSTVEKPVPDQHHRLRGRQIEAATSWLLPWVHLLDTVHFQTLGSLQQTPQS